LIYKKYDNKLVIRIDPCEEVVDTIKNVCAQLKIKSGIINGIGASNEATIGIYYPGIKLYQTKIIKGNLEITSLSGNITSMNNEVYVHIHATIADEYYVVWGGHLNSAIVSVTCEVFIEILEYTIIRKNNPEIGINVIELE